MKMLTRERMVVLAVALLSYSVFGHSAYAMGEGEGRTKIDFTTKTADTASSRLFAKIDVSAGITSNANFIAGNTATVGNGKHGNGNGHGNGASKHNGLNNFVLANCDVTLTIGSASFTGHADSKGKITQPFNAKLTANGQILQIMANGLNLVELFPLNTSNGHYQVSVPFTVTATRSTSNADGSTSSLTVTLSQQVVNFKYSVKNGRAMGRNF